jgi:hypothetical protein
MAAGRTGIGSQGESNILKMVMKIQDSRSLVLQYGGDTLPAMF